MSDVSQLLHEVLAVSASRCRLWYQDPVQQQLLLSVV